MSIFEIYLNVRGTFAVALAIFSALSIATGSVLNQIKNGMGNLAIASGIFALIILVLCAVFWAYNSKQ